SVLPRQQAAIARLSSTLPAGSGVVRTTIAPAARLGIAGSMSEAGSEGFGGGKHGVGMAIDLDFGPDAANDACLVDEEGRPLHPHAFATVHAPLQPVAVALADPRLLVGGKREGQLVLRLEFVVGSHIVLGDADHRRSDLREVGQRVAEAAGLLGAAGGVV